MAVRLPTRTLLLRWNAILCAIAIFVWSTPEEDRVIWSSLLGIWLALTLLLGVVVRRAGGRVLRGWRAPLMLALFGAAVGAAGNICAVLLMLFKDARHAHIFPDYPPALLGAMLSLLPVWALAGALFGLGAALALATRPPRLPDTASSVPPHML